MATKDKIIADFRQQVIAITHDRGTAEYSAELKQLTNEMCDKLDHDQTFEVVCDNCGHIHEFTAQEMDDHGGDVICHICHQGTTGDNL